MPRDLIRSGLRGMIAGVIYCLSLMDINILSAEDPDPAKCCNNQVFAAFFLQAPISIAETSQGIDRVLFSKSKFAQIYFKNGVLADPKARYGNHAATCTGTENGVIDDEILVMAPQVFFAIDLLPELPPMVGRQPRGTLTAIYAGYRMKPVNGWYPEETKFGVFGATFRTQVRNSPASDREFIRLPTEAPDLGAGFSLPIDLDKNNNADRLSYSREISMRPCAVYEDFGFTEWIIYSRIVDDEIEISHRQVKKNYDTLTMNGTTELVTQRYGINDTVQVSNLKFRIEEIVKFDDQVVPVAWINIADIDVVRP